MRLSPPPPPSLRPGSREHPWFNALNQLFLHLQQLQHFKNLQNLSHFDNADLSSTEKIHGTDGQLAQTKVKSTSNLPYAGDYIEHNETSANETKKCAGYLLPLRSPVSIL